MEPSRPTRPETKLESYGGTVPDARVSLIDGSDLVAHLDDADLYLVDVREPDEVAEWSIPGVHNYPLESLASRVDEIPREKELVVVCAKGVRALKGAEILA